MITAVSNAKAVVNGAGDGPHAFPPWFAAADIGAYAGSVVAVAKIAAVEIVAIFAFPAGIAEAKAAECAANAMLAAAVVVTVAVVVFILVVVDAVAVVVFVLFGLFAVAIDVIVFTVRFPIAIDIAVAAVVDAVAIHVVVRGVGLTIPIQVPAFDGIIRVGAVGEFVEVAGAVAVGVTEKSGDDVVIVVVVG